MNIPIYRAKKKDSNEYTEGFLYQDVVSYVPSDGVKPDEYNKALDEESWFLMDNMGRNEMIDITTLAIHFPDMLDSQGNKIFASLQEDRKGGDRIIEDGKYEDGFNPVFEPYFRKSSFSIYDLPKTRYGEYELHQYKVIGIQE